MRLWKLIVAILLATFGCAATAMRWPTPLSGIAFFTIPFLMHYRSWEHFERTLSRPITKRAAVWIFVGIGAFVVFIVWQGLYLPSGLRSAVDSTSPLVAAVLWVVLVAAILAAWFRARRAQVEGAA